MIRRTIRRTAVALALTVSAAASLGAQTPDPVCRAVARVALDSLAKRHLSSTVLTAYQVRAVATLDSLHAVKCVGSTPVPPPPPPPPPPAHGIAELPRSVPTFPAALASAACTDTIAAGLQTALGAARGGDVLCLSGTFPGSYTLPARGDTGWVVVRSLVSVAAPGQRMRPSLAGPLAKVVATRAGSASAIITAPSARGWYLAELEVTTDSTLGTGPSPIINVATPPDSLGFASDIVLDRLYIHGWPHQTIRRCVAFNGKASTIMHSWVDECHEKGADSQALSSWSGMGPLLIENNYLAGAGENLMFGGAEPRFRTRPSDITISGNHIATPPHWKTRWTKKNLLETKNAQRVLVERNVFDGSWGDAQTGYAILVKSSNQPQTGGLAGLCPWCGSYDITIRTNLVVNAASAFNPNGRGGGLPVDTVTSRVTFSGNYAEITGQQPWGYERRGTMILGGIRHLVMDGNTLLFVPGQGADYTTSTGASLPVDWTLTNNVTVRGQYLTLNCLSATCAPGLVRSGNVSIGAPGAALPSGFSTAPDLATALSLGAGISRATIDAAVRGVVILP